MDLEPLISRMKLGAAGDTGGWRNYRPLINKEICNKCKNCFSYCPEGVISEEIEIDYRFCKGCGICKEMCKQKAIEMHPE
ncbi:MAG: 4Fe-4S binding protein [Archaeoglobaceae archaeon]|nr:4Fe-4S binding protein [Archaeoglobaceae archaeon]MDW8118849.1 4Fe-4S binding protein [Archaeoglobaceae archaeon]